MRPENEEYVKTILPTATAYKGPSLDSDIYPMLEPSEVKITAIDFAKDTDGLPQHGSIEIKGEVKGSPITFYIAEPLNLPVSE